jgi:hypothetical protein
VQEAFTPSVFWAFDIAAESDGRVFVDATDFFLRDTHGAARRMNRYFTKRLYTQSGRSAGKSMSMPPWGPGGMPGAS